MSINSQILDLKDNLLAAKEAVNNKGGTADTTSGFVALADEIATIPAGGGGGGVPIAPIQSNYGVLYYYKYMENGRFFVPMLEPGDLERAILVEDIDDEKLDDFMDTYLPGSSTLQLEFIHEYNNHRWYFPMSSPTMYISDNDFENTTGIKIYFAPKQDGVSLRLIVGTGGRPKKGSEIAMVELAQGDLSILTQYDVSRADPFPYISAYGGTVPRSAIYRVDLGLSASSIGPGFLCNCPYLKEVYTTWATGLSSLSENFLRNCFRFNSEIDLTVARGNFNIGENFLMNCGAFNQPINFPSGLATINPRFLCGCRSFNQDIELPSTVYTIYEAFLSFCDSMCGTITANAAPWGLSSDSRSLATLNKDSSLAVTGIGVNGSYAQEFVGRLSPEYGQPWYRNVYLRA